MMFLEFLRLGIKHRNLAYPVVILILLVLLADARKSIVQLETMYAAKPKVVEKETIKTVRGPTRTIWKERIIKEPGQVEVVELTKEVYIEREEVTAGHERSEAPVDLPRHQAKRWLVGIESSPLDLPGALEFRAGATIFDRFDLTAGYQLYGAGRDRIRAGVALRF